MLQPELPATFEAVLNILLSLNASSVVDATLQPFSRCIIHRQRISSSPPDMVIPVVPADIIATPESQ